MICPECNGSGRVRTRFLLFFTRGVRCRKCLGSGEFPPPVAHRNRYMRYVRDEDRDAWESTTGVGMGVIASRLEESPERDTVRSDAFDVGSGGRSGGAGATASWDDPSSDEAPVIVDPFAGDASAVSGAVGAAIVAEAVDAADSGSSSDGYSADSSDSSSVDSGTGY